MVPNTYTKIHPEKHLFLPETRTVLQVYAISIHTITPVSHKSPVNRPAPGRHLRVELVVFVDEVVQRRQGRDEVFLADHDADVARLSIVSDLDHAIPSRFLSSRAAKDPPSVLALFEGRTRGRPLLRLAQFLELLEHVDEDALPRCQKMLGQKPIGLELTAA